MKAFWQDVRYGFRVLSKSPGFTIVAVFVTALGIGANTAIFSVVNAVLLRPLPFKEPDRLVLVREHLPKLYGPPVNLSGAEFLDYREGSNVFSQTAGFTDSKVNLTGAGEPQRVQAARVSASFFPTLGVAPALGRNFSAEEDQPGRNDVVILSNALWRGQFGGDPSIVGQTVRMDGRPFTVVGVMPPSFEFPYRDELMDAEAELWVPLALTDREKQGRADSFDFRFVGRLKPGVTLAQAQADIGTIAARMRREHPDVYSGNLEMTASVVPLKEKIVGRVRPLLLILFGAVGLVLLISCANVANLLLARAAARQKEIALRSVLGAGSLRLVRQLLTESLLLALLSGAFGLLIAVWAVALIVRFGPRDVPRLQDVGLDTTVLVFTLLASLLTGVLFGIAPAIHGARLNLSDALKQTAGRASGGRESKRLRGLLVVFETAAAVVLLVSAGLLVNSFVRLMRVPPGFDPEGVIVARTALPATRYPKEEQNKAAYRQILARLAATPGVKSAGVATYLPLAGDWGIGFRVEGAGEGEFHSADGTWVSNDYLGTMGIRLLKGRGFTDDDREDTPPVVIVNETLARTYFPGGEAVGKRVQWGGWPGAQWLTVVGVVNDVKVSALDAATQPMIYMPIFQIPRARPNVIFVARTDSSPAALAASMREAITSVDRELPAYDIRTMNDVVSESVAQRRFSTVLLSVFGATALLLAAVGVFGVMSYTVTQRTQEIGIRMALGARGRDVLRMVVGQGMRLGLAGVAVGVVAALGLTRLLAGLLFGVRPSDPLTFAAAALVITAVALLACYVPARRATKVDPTVALRYE
jgi:putative ABC transport system permease protein